MYYIETIKPLQRLELDPNSGRIKLQMAKMEKNAITLLGVYDDGTYDCVTNKGISIVGGSMDITDENGKKVLPSEIMSPISREMKEKSKEEILLARIIQLEASLEAVNSKVTEIEPKVNDVISAVSAISK